MPTAVCDDYYREAIYFEGRMSVYISDAGSLLSDVQGGC